MTAAAPDAHVLEAVLGLPAPWRIERVDVGEQDASLHVWLTHAPDVRWACPACDHQGVHSDRGTERVWRHLDIFQYQTFLHAYVPCVTCPTHGVADLAMPWAGGGRGYTTAMEQHIIALTDSAGVQQASRVLKIGWEDAWALMMSRRVGV